MPKIRFSIAWLLVLTALFASLSVHIANYRFKSTLQESRFSFTDRGSVQGSFVDLATNDQLCLRFCSCSDSGVEIERVKNGETIWREYMEGLGTKLTWYKHAAVVQIDNWETTRKIEVVSNGSSGRITEIRNVDTGDLISRDSIRVKER